MVKTTLNQSLYAPVTSQKWKIQAAANRPTPQTQKRRRRRVCLGLLGAFIPPAAAARRLSAQNMPLPLFLGLLLSDRIQLACWSLILIYCLSFFAPSNKQADVKQVRPVHSISGSQSGLTVQHPHASHTSSGYLHTMNHQPAPIW